MLSAGSQISLYLSEIARFDGIREEAASAVAAGKSHLSAEAGFEVR